MPHSPDFDPRDSLIPDKEPDLCVTCGYRPEDKRELEWWPGCWVRTDLVRGKWTLEPGWRCKDRDHCEFRRWNPREEW